METPISDEIRKQFFTTTRLGLANELRSILDDSPELINAKYDDGTSPLVLAIECEREDIVDVLLRMGADAASGLWHSIWQDSSTIVAKLLDAGADPNARLANGETPLMSADSVSVARTLIDHGADVNAAREDGYTPLVNACYGPHADMVRLLLENGADPNPCGGTDKPLHIASWEGSSAIVRMLLEAGADPLAKDKRGCTSMMLALKPEGAYNWWYVEDKHTWAAERADRLSTAELILQRLGEDALNLSEASALGLLHRVRHLVEADPQAVDRVAGNGCRALHYAACWGHTDIVQLLLSIGASIRRGEDEEYTSLALAGGQGHCSIIVLLLSAGADVGETDKDGATALHAAACAGQAAAIDLLLQRGANPNAMDEDGYSPLHNALGTIDCIRKLIDAGADLSARNGNGDTPLRAALDCGQWALATAIFQCVGAGAVSLFDLAALGDLDTLSLQISADFSIAFSRDSEWKNLSLLHAAALRNQTGVATLLLGLGLNPNAPDDEGATALHSACESGEGEVVALLLANGADPNIIDDLGFAPLHEAAFHRNSAATELLLAYGADPNTNGAKIGMPYDCPSRKEEQLLLRRAGGLRTIEEPES